PFPQDARTALLPREPAAERRRSDPEGAMADAVGPKSRRPRIVVLVALAAALAAGVGLGVLLDRLWLRPTPGAAPVAAPGPRLVGRWLAEEAKTPLEFRADGTFEYVRVTTTEVPVFGPRPDDIKKEKVREEEPVTGQYRWADGGTIELLEPDSGG